MQAPRQEPPRQEAPKPVEVAALQPRPEIAVPVSTRNDADDPRRVNVPLPQRRPSTLVIGPTLVNIPLPQSRPSVLVAAASPVQPEPIAQAMAAPSRPAEPDKTVQAAARPTAPALPQPRPGDLPNAITAGLRTTTTDGSTGALAYAPQAQPQRIVPAQPAAQAAPQQVAAAPAAVDRRAMNSLMAQIAATANPDRGGRVAPTSVAAVTGIKTVTGRFETLQPQQKVETAGFSGSAIRPLAPQGFRRVE